ncbi:MAG: 50S ribosomal protein L25/general stress protein Ctc [Geodermatophilaceae bacterium]
MAEVRITAQPRTEFGKGYARRTRRAGLVPAVLYGHGEDVRHLSLSAREFSKALKGGSNTLLTVALDGETRLALPKAVTRHPIRPEFTHVDLLLVRRGEKVTVDVAVHLIGEPAPETVANQELTSLTVEAEATHIPQSFVVSIKGKHVGQSILAGDIPLTSGTTLVTEADNLVVGSWPHPRRRSSKPSWKRPRPRSASSATPPTKRSRLPPRPRRRPSRTTIPLHLPGTRPASLR